MCVTGMSSSSRKRSTMPVSSQFDAPGGDDWGVVLEKDSPLTDCVNQALADLEEDGELRAYGAGILSSYGEIEEFRNMEIRPLDFSAMATIEYDITHYQPVLFGATSMGHLVDAVGGFFASVDDDTPARLEEEATARR